MQGNSFTNWGKLTPRHNSFINAILESSCHILTTVRRKQEYALWKDEKTWKSTVEKLWLKEVIPLLTTTIISTYLWRWALWKFGKIANIAWSKKYWAATSAIFKEIWEEIREWNLSWEKVKPLEEIQRENFEKYYKLIKECDTIGSLKNVFTEAQKSKISKEQLDEIIILKNEIKLTLTPTE